MSMLAFFRPRYDALLAILGLLAIACLIATPVAVLAMISVIGLPLALLMAAIPPIFVVLLVARLVYVPLQARGGIGSRIASIVLALALLAIVPWQVNARLDRRAAALVGADLPAPAAWPAAKSLAIRIAGRGHWGRDETRCDDLCLRVLLGGHAQRVLLVFGADLASAPGPGTMATSFRLEQRSQCPPVMIRPGIGALNPPPERPAVVPAERMRLAIAGGTCLIEETVPLGEADMVISLGAVANGKTAFAAGLDPFADTVRADRVEVHRKAGAGFEAIFRHTRVSVDRLAPILAPSYVSGYGLELKAGLIRLAGGARAGHPADRKPDLAEILTKRLQLDLALPQAAPGPGPAGILAAALDRPGPIDDTVQDIARDVFQAFTRQRTIDATTRALAMRVLGDDRIPVNRYAWALVKYTDDAAALDAIARTLFERLRATDPLLRDRETSYLGYPAGYIGTAIAALPPAAVQPYRADLEWLAHQRILRIPAWPALKQLSAFGAGAAETLLFLIDDAGDPKIGTKPRGDAWQHPYLAGLTGLCLAGRTAEAATAPLLERLAQGRLAKHGSYHRLLVNTLVALGAEPAAIWSALGDPDMPEARKRFDHEVERARRRTDCSY